MASSRMVCIGDYEQYAENNLPKLIREYFNSGANYEQTSADNVAAFKRYRFRPRYMRDASNLQLSTSLLGHDVKCPIGVSPMGMCRLAHPDGEVALAKACETEDLCFCLSMTATSSLEEVGHAAPGCLRWFQMHMLKDRDLMQRMMQRAERSGFSAIALTVDCAVHGRRYNLLRNKFSLPPHLKFLRFANFEEELKQAKSELATDKTIEDWGKLFDQASTTAQTWKDIQWLKTVTPLPIVAKGIVTAFDATQALNHGADAIWVSNHGGRQLDCLPATIDVLDEVCMAVAGRAEVYLDGGVRSGLDILKALSRGAHAVFCGHPTLWGLVKDGETGARDVLSILKEELQVGMALSGVTKVQHVPKDSVVHESFFSKL